MDDQVATYSRQVQKRSRYIYLAAAPQSATFLLCPSNNFDNKCIQRPSSAYTLFNHSIIEVFPAAIRFNFCYVLWYKTISYRTFTHSVHST